jgi:hypothetical protein
MKSENTYIYDKTNNLIHFYRCSKVGIDFFRFKADDFMKYLMRKGATTCDVCGKINERMVNNGLGNLICVFLVMSIMTSIINNLIGTPPYTKYVKLWIESPTGFKVQLPLYQALRIARKHGWKVSNVEPIKPHLTRWQHFKIAIGVSKDAK